MMKKFLGLSWDEAIAEAVRQGRSYKELEADEFDDARIEVSTIEGNGAILYFEDGKVDEYEFECWL